ncbi:hypothetical protein JDV02_009386 [Purpureocillium takamizusanense]|uniref:Uncharacterized protein n=1 Tax=Purpureocillium takamizusanense TaxID=2060973 RepID=A0A9Q8QPU6_9HYPO|nr:uncharacterized protein JDV02_009386 [Purpureocillium takamizusanense]UNI23573.1 hypothetical protein JDV02_009386 [Purpureocillium takamizusanense]
MPPTAEGSAPWVFGSRSGRAASARPGTPVPPPRSEKRNPFSAPEDENNSERRSSSDGTIPRSMVEYHSERRLHSPGSHGPDLAHEATSPELGGDRATSDWETVVASDESGRHAYPLQGRHETNAFEVQGLTGHSYRLENQPQRPNTILGPASLAPASEPQQGPGATQTNEPTDIRYSSFVNERRDKAANVNVVDDFSGNEPHEAFSRKRGNTPVVDNQGPGGLAASNSMTSSSLTVDRFKFDDGHYAVFLRPGAEREARAELDDDDQPSVQNPQFYDPSAIQST